MRKRPQKHEIWHLYSSSDIMIFEDISTLRHPNTHLKNITIPNKSLKYEFGYIQTQR